MNLQKITADVIRGCELTTDVVITGMFTISRNLVPFTCFIIGYLATTLSTSTVPGEW